MNRLYISTNQLIGNKFKRPERFGNILNQLRENLEEHLESTERKFGGAVLLIQR